MPTIPVAPPSGSESKARLRSTAERIRPRRVLLAVDGSCASDAAVRVTADLARVKPVAVEVLTVARPIVAPVPPPEMGLPPLLGSWKAVDANRRRLETRGALDLVLGVHTTWPIDVEMGTAPVVIAREAERRTPDLIVMGLRRHGKLDRLMRDETTFRVVRHARVPVLAVTAALEALPRRIVVGMDFSRASLRAARAALALLPEGGTLILAHVRPGLEFTAEASEGWGVLYTQGIAGAFKRLRKELAAPKGITVETAYLEGPAASALLSFAARAHADLIAVGTHRHGFAERLIVGSVTETLLREAGCSLLITPPVDRAGRG